jgi:hypothetical protein
MKSSISTLALAALVAIASLTQAHAQTLASRVNVPFAFDCGGQHFAPGAYTVSRRDLGSQEILTLWDGKSTSQVQINLGDGPSNVAPAYVTFRKYGNRYFLAGYHPSNSGTTMEVPASSQERIVARDFALYPAQDRGRVELAMNDSNLSR